MGQIKKIPTFTYGEEISVKKLTEIKNALKAIPELCDIRVSYMPFFIKAMSNALKHYPILNSHYDEKKESIIYRNKHNIGIAMDTKVGLGIPVMKNVDSLTFLEVAKELMRFAKCGEKGTFSPADVSDVTILISNIGAIGGTYVKPVPVAKTSTIIALGAIQVVPRFDSLMNVVPDEIVAFSGSADHRIIDGATMARFAKIFKSQIENPLMLLLHNI